MEDRELVCRDCKQSFVFPAQESEFFQKKGFADPIRCKPCRDLKKQSRPRQDQQTG